LEDDETLSKKAGEIIDKINIHLPFEVCAEVVYVLEKVYVVPRENIRNALALLIGYQNISTNDKSVFISALEIYHTKNIDFLGLSQRDCLEMNCASACFGLCR
jgi:predicted nucleic-acid-binding protein